MKVNYNRFGSGIPLVFFHGFGFDHTIWHPLVSHLSKYFTIYLIDLPGFGKTERGLWEEFKLNLLINLPHQFIVIGWSLGGLYATRLAIEESSRVTHLINVASSPRFIKDVEWPGVDAAVFDGFYHNLMANPKKTLKEFLQFSVRTPLDNMELAIPSKWALNSGLRCLKEWDFRKKLTNFKKPTYYWFGGKDAIIPKNTMAVMEQIYPHFHYSLFPRGSHVPFLSDKNDFIQLLSDTLL